MGHHTKEKGDLGVAKAFADLTAQGYLILFPATEHASFDLVAYRDGTFFRVQVKFRTATNGSIAVSLRSTWADRHGVHSRDLNKSEVDVICVYCPNTDECYYVDSNDVKQAFALRLVDSRNNQRVGVHYASSHRLMPPAPLHSTIPMTI